MFRKQFECEQKNEDFMKNEEYSGQEEIGVQIKKKKLVDFERLSNSKLVFVGFIDSLDIIDIEGMVKVNFGRRRLFNFGHLDFFPNNSVKLNIGSWKNKEVSPKDVEWQLEFVEEKLQTFKVTECIKNFVFIEAEGWVHRITIFQSVFNKSFAFLQVDSLPVVVG